MNLPPPQTFWEGLVERVLINWKSTLVGLLSLGGGVLGVITNAYYPNNTAPKMVIVISGVIGTITTLLAKDK